MGTQQSPFGSEKSGSKPGSAITFSAGGRPVERRHRISEGGTHEVVALTNEQIRLEADLEAYKRKPLAVDPPAKVVPAEVGPKRSIDPAKVLERLHSGNRRR